MILLLDTSSALARLILVSDGEYREYEWQADRLLAKGLLGWIVDVLAETDMTFQDITGIGARKGPGSFTGLRIGLTVLNTLADSMAIPIVGESSDEWRDVCVSRLKAGENDGIILPLYDREANITKPRK